jgi:hypothetical protein
MNKIQNKKVNKISKSEQKNQNPKHFVLNLNKTSKSKQS